MVTHDQGTFAGFCGRWAVRSGIIGGLGLGGRELGKVIGIDTALGNDLVEAGAWVAGVGLGGAVLLAVVGLFAISFPDEKHHD